MRLALAASCLGLLASCARAPQSPWEVVGVFSGPMETWTRIETTLRSHSIACSDGGGSIVYPILVPPRDAERAKALLTEDAAKQGYWFQTVEVFRERQQTNAACEDADRSLAQGRVDEAIRGYSHAISTAPGCVRGYLGRASARREKGEVQGAIDDLERAMELLRVADLPHEHVKTDLQALKNTLPH